MNLRLWLARILAGSQYQVIPRLTISRTTMTNCTFSATTDVSMWTDAAL